ncbi:Heat shock cognate protein HSP 90-beta [Echinococcus granulosus]|nr:Heat shock cognate protein HSP 90-beta [Echinococcus granulosus]
MSDQEATTDDATEQKVETFAFQADTRQLLNVLVNALYPTKDVFLRELVSNASDALDKLRYKSLTQPSVLETNAEMCIRIVPNKADATLAIMDTGVEECESLIPDYLNFLIGVVDSEDLPLNLSREAIRESSVVRAIGKHLVRKSIELMQEMAEDAQAYSAFYGNFQRSIKLGVYEDRGHRQKLANLLRYYSSKSGDEMIGLREYVCRMKEGQSDIYCMIGESMASVSDSVFMEGLKKRDVEVLLMVDPMDEYVVNAMTEYLGKSLVCVSRLDLQLPEEKVEAVVAEEEGKTTTQGEWMECVVADFESTCGKMKEILGERVESVRVSSRLTTSPCCVVTSTFGWSANMQRIGKAQALRNPHSLRNNSAKKHLEINANDSIIIGLKKMLSTEGMPNKISRDMLEILYNTALLDSGFVLKEPKTHTNTIHALIRMFLEIPECESVKDAEQVTADSDEAALVQAGDDGGAMGEVG